MYCSICGQIKGEPLTASFEEHGLSITAEEGTTYDYVTGCYDDTSEMTVGQVTFSEYRIAKEDTDLGLKKKDGMDIYDLADEDTLFFRMN